MAQVTAGRHCQEGGVRGNYNVSCRKRLSLGGEGFAILTLKMERGHFSPLQLSPVNLFVPASFCLSEILIKYDFPSIIFKNKTFLFMLLETGFIYFCLFCLFHQSEESALLLHILSRLT